VTASARRSPGESGLSITARSVSGVGSFDYLPSDMCRDTYEHGTVDRERLVADEPAVDGIAEASMISL
jgi:hypothetical protein